MSSAVFVPVDEYLHTVYRPDCDYVDGVVEERCLGELDHGRVQANLVVAFRSRRQYGLDVIPEWRFQLTPTRFRVPDIIVTRGETAGKNSDASTPFMR